MVAPASGRQPRQQRVLPSWPAVSTLPDPSAGAVVDAVDLLLLQRLHSQFPLSDAPYADVASDLGLSEHDVLERLRRMIGAGLLSRLGPLFDLRRGDEGLLLAAMQVPEPRFDAVAATVNALSEVASNHRREHPFNMWFVIDCRSDADACETCHRIEALTGLRVYVFPAEKEFFGDMRLAADRREDTPC